MSTLDREGERRRRSAEDLYQHARSALRAGEHGRARKRREQAAVKLAPMGLAAGVFGGVGIWMRLTR